MNHEFYFLSLVLFMPDTLSFLLHVVQITWFNRRRLRKTNTFALTRKNSRRPRQKLMRQKLRLRRRKRRNRVRLCWNLNLEGDSYVFRKLCLYY